MGSWDYDLISKASFWDEGQSAFSAWIMPASFRRWRRSANGSIPRFAGSPRAFTALRPDRETCEVEFRIVRPTGEARWCTAAACAAFNAAGALVRLSGVTTDITDRKEADDHQALLVREVDHRAKNALAVVQAIVRMAKRESIDEYVKAVEGRIGALAQTHELLSQSKWEGADICLVLDELAPYRNDGQQRITAIGPLRAAASRRNWWPWRFTSSPQMPPNMALSVEGRVDVTGPSWMACCPWSE